MPDEVFEARLLPRRKDGDVEVFRMRVLDSNGNPIDLAGGGSGESLPEGGPGVLTREEEDGEAAWIETVELDAAALPSTPFGSIAASNVQDALEEITGVSIIVVDAETDLDSERPVGASAVYWRFDVGTVVGTAGENVTNALPGDLIFVADA